MPARSSLVLLAAVVTAVGLAPVGASAQDADPWTAGWVAPVDEPAAIGAPTDLVGWVRYDRGWTVDTISLAVIHAGDPPLAEACPSQLPVDEPAPPSSTSSTSSTSQPGEPDAVEFTFAARSATPPCNGTYTATVTVTATPPTASDAVLAKTLLVAIPPPPVTSVEAVLNEGRTITVRWLPPDGYAPPPDGSTDSVEQEAPTGPPADFAGYLVERSVAGTEWQPLGTAAPGIHELTDTELPTAGGEMAYRVRALRPGAASGETVASPEETSGTAVAIAGAVPTPGGSGGSGGRIPARSRPNFPTSPTTFDVVPDGDIPEPGEDDPVLPDDIDELGGPIVRDVEPGPDGRALLVPAASALLLVVWAMHIRYLSRLAARPRAAPAAWLPDP